MLHCKDQCQEFIQKMLMTYKTQLLHLLHSPILQLPRKLWQNYIEKWFYCWKRQPSWKIATILDIRSRKIKIQIPHSQTYMIIQIGQLSGVLFKNVYFDIQNGSHLEKRRPSWHFDRLKVFFQKSSPQGVFMPILMLVSGFERCPRKVPHFMHCRPRSRVYLPCSGYFACMTLKVWRYTRHANP